MHNARKRLLAGPYLVWIIGFTVLPILMILYYAFTNSDGGFTWANIAAIADPVHIKALLLSLKLGILCTVVCLLLSYPLAMILNSLHIKHQSFVVFIFVLPMWMNFMNYQWIPFHFWHPEASYVKYTGSRCIWHDL